MGALLSFHFDHHEDDHARFNGRILQHKEGDESYIVEVASGSGHGHLEISLWLTPAQIMDLATTAQQLSAKIERQHSAPAPECVA